jgi:YVTN family beta-propeller protein
MGLALTPDAKFAYVTDYATSTVLILKTKTLRVLNVIAVGPLPTSVAITPNAAVVADHDPH